MRHRSRLLDVSMLNVPRYPPFVVNAIVKLPELTSLNSTLATYVRVTDYKNCALRHAYHCEFV